MAWAPDYATASEMKAYTYISDTVDDTQISLALTAASRAIDDFVHRQFGQVASAEARYYQSEWDYATASWYVELDDLQDATGFQVLTDSAGDLSWASEVTSTYYRLRPLNAAARGRPWTHLEILGRSPVPATSEVKVTGLWGWSSVPSEVKQACLLQASRILARRQSPFGIAGASPEGPEIRLLSRLDVDVELQITGLRRTWSVANGR